MLSGEVHRGFKGDTAHQLHCLTVGETEEGDPDRTGEEIRSHRVRQFGLLCHHTRPSLHDPTLPEYALVTLCTCCVTRSASCPTRSRSASPTQNGRRPSTTSGFTINSWRWSEGEEEIWRRRATRCLWKTSCPCTWPVRLPLWRTSLCRSGRAWRCCILRCTKWRPNTCRSSPRSCG